MKIAMLADRFDMCSHVLFPIFERKTRMGSARSQRLDLETVDLKACAMQTPPALAQLVLRSELHSAVKPAWLAGEFSKLPASPRGERLATRPLRTWRPRTSAR